MTEHEAFLAQAASDYDLFKLLLNFDRDDVPACHPLHYLQMATEKLAKAVMLSLGQQTDKLTHVALSHFPSLLARSDIARRLGWRSSKAFRQFLKKSAPLFRQIDELNPSVGSSQVQHAVRSQPNVEYPWQSRDSAGALGWSVPATHRWVLIEQLRSGQAAQVLELIEVLLERFNYVLADLSED